MFKLLFFAFVLKSIVAGDVNPKCRHPSAAKRVHGATESECMGTWHVYAMSVPCENCCVMRKLTQLQPGVVALTQSLQKGDSTPTLMETAVRKDSDAGIYRTNGSDPVALLGVNCKNYIVSYNLDTNLMTVYVRNHNPSSETIATVNNLAKKCNVKLHKYDMNCGKTATDKEAEE